MQECQGTSAQCFNRCGWEIHYSDNRRAAVAWHGEFSRDVIAKRGGHRFASVEFAGLVCTSVYLPCAQTDTDHVAEYLDVLVKVSMCMHECQQTSYQFVGTDAQVELEGNTVGFTGGGLEVERGTEEQMKTKWYHEEKRAMLMHFMIEWKLAAANTFGQRQITHVPHNKAMRESVGLHACSDALMCSG